MTPETVSYGSKQSVWWKCGRGHRWKALVKTRAAGCGCPVCANRTLAPGENDLAAVCPDLAEQWHPDKNGSLTPCDVFPGTKRRVWWRCGRGHEWQASVLSRACGGSGCPVCAGKVVIPGDNDLATVFPAIAGQWHPTKNGGLKPAEVSPYSNRKAWWLCPLGHEYPAMINHRTAHGSGCPYCAGRKVLPGFNDLAAAEPQIAAQWHPALNGALTPEAVTARSHKKVWWQCPEGHVWKAVIYSRTGPEKCGCPVCAGKVNPDRQRRYAAAQAEFVPKAATAAFEDFRLEDTT